MKEADRVFSLWVRLSRATEDGYGTCYTCGHQAHYKKLQAGHYVSRYVKQLRYEVDNVKIQCPMCNIWKRGDLLTFRENLVRDLGEPRVLELEAKRKELFKPTRTFYEEKISHYKALLETL